MPAPSRPRILIVDDEAAQMRALCDTLRDQGYDTTGFTDARVALDMLSGTRFDLLLADLMMPAMDGIALLQAAQRLDGDLVGIIMTGEGTIATAVAAMKGGALDYILKPFKLSVILPVVARALAVRDLRLANAALEQSVRERTAELEAANAELEAFAFSVSHDLRSPLSVIIGAAEILSEDHAQLLAPQARQAVDGIMVSAERAARLINDLLRLSRLGRQPLSKRPIDIRALVDEVLDEVRDEARQPPIDVRIGPLCNASGDPALLRQVFVNLLSNAFKFTRGRASPIVEIACEGRDGERVYSVRDNGAGFDAHAATDLFGAFRRFHTTQQFDGTGVGLSIARRIVERHGGRIWAESAPDCGATFRFSLPD
jgi:signal transduction histidine kinase